MKGWAAESVARSVGADRLAPAQAYHSEFNEEIPVAQLVRETAAVMQEFTRKGSGIECREPRIGGEE